jgi:hypothetical protein
MAESETESKSSSAFTGLMKWIGGIVASVITAFLIYKVIPSPPPTPVPPMSRDFYGVVSNAASNAPIPNARVQVGLGQGLVYQTTDNSGKYNIYVQTQVTGPVTTDVSIAAEGYRTFSQAVTLQPVSNFAEILLQPSVTPPGRPEAPAPLGAIGRKEITFSAPPPSFAKREASVVLKEKH